jgi:ADP-heptose:LPS heptosyltransferase
MQIAIGLASGIGNAVFMLPTIKALKLMGHDIQLHVQTDYQTMDLWRRCEYVDSIVLAHANLNGYKPICGQWRPAAWALIRPMQHKVTIPYRMSEADSNFRLAKNLGWKDERPDVSDWCRDLNQDKRWDIGIIPGSKDGVWMRKRYPRMAEVSQHFINQSKRVAVFGLESDGCDQIPGEWMRPAISELPDFLASCRVIIGTDSGIAHLANSLGVPTVMIFTATSDVKGRPLGRHIIVKSKLKCRPCQSIPHWFTCREWKCREIGIDAVIQAVDGIL